LGLFSGHGEIFEKEKDFTTDRLLTDDVTGTGSWVVPEGNTIGVDIYSICMYS
jgi:hypothetical protein